MRVTSEPARVGDVVIEELDIASMSEQDVARLNAFDNALAAEVLPEDPPTPVELTKAEYENIPDFFDFREWWALDPDGRLAATGEIWWTLTDDNRHVARVSVDVRPDRRRRGIATELIRLCAEAADAAGRTLLVGVTNERVPAGQAFARRVGASAGLEEHTNRLVLERVDRDMVRRWVDEGAGRAPGYSLVAVDGPYPDDLVEAIVPVHEIMNTAPRGDLEMEDRRYTVHHLREWEKTMVAMGTERWSLFARHDASGELVGLTEVGWSPAQPKTVFQWATAVDPGHRGHALGKWLKATMLERVLRERPDVEDVRTGNADSNDAMLGINHALGFEPFIADTIWQVPTEKVRAYVESRVGSSR